MDQSKISTDTVESPEELQQRLYFLLEQLQDMAKALPPLFQQRVSCELLSTLANCLLTDTIYEIVKGLMDIQHVTEKQLEQQRINMTKTHRLEMAKMATETKCPNLRRRKKQEIEIRQRAQLAEMDKSIILHLDAKVKDQQTTLEMAGVPGFFVTDNPTAVRVQMHIIDFILRIGNTRPLPYSL